MKKAKLYLLFAVLLLVVGVWVLMPEPPDVSRIVLYSQGEEKWADVEYGVDKNLRGSGCGVFTLAHAAQWLGLEEKDEEEYLPEEYAFVFTPEYCGYYTNTGMDVCTTYFGSTLYEDQDIVSGWAAKEEPPLRDVLRKGGVAVLHIKTPQTGHWVLAASLSPDGRKVLVLDSSINVIADAGLKAYQCETDHWYFTEITDWSTLARDGNLRVGAAYWLDYDDAQERHSGMNYIMPKGKKQ